MFNIFLFKNFTASSTKQNHSTSNFRGEIQFGGDAHHFALPLLGARAPPSLRLYILGREQVMVMMMMIIRMIMTMVMVVVMMMNFRDEG